MQSSEVKKRLPLKHIMKSVFGAFIGIQNRQHADKDFKQGSIYVFGAVGIIGVILFIAIIVTIVKWVLA